MSSWRERCKADRMRISSSGASGVADDPAMKKFPSGMRFFENAGGGMTRARGSFSRRRKRVSEIVATSKRGWTCMTQRKEERQLSLEAGRLTTTPAVLLSLSLSAHESAVNVLAEHPAVHVNVRYGR